MIVNRRAILHTYPVVTQLWPENKRCHNTKNHRLAHLPNHSQAKDSSRVPRAKPIQV